MKILYLPNAYSQQRQKDVKANIYPVLMAMEATRQRNVGHEVLWNEPNRYEECDCIVYDVEGYNFLDLPIPDRKLTKAWEYMDNGNYKYLPATHMQAARDCWYHKCNFCAWAKKYPVCETRSVLSVISEVNECVKLGFREIFDDSGTFPVGDWLRAFCQSMISTGLNKEVVLGCNMRFGALDLEDFALMKAAGFRMILWGMESVNQFTLDKLNKGITAERAFVDLDLANRAGLWNHVAIMFGYPWESWIHAKLTYDIVRQGLLTNKIKTVQASIYDVEEWYNSFAPYEKEGILDYAYGFRKKIYAIYHDPRYLWHRIKEIRNFDDIQYYLRGFKKLWGRK